MVDEPKRCHLLKQRLCQGAGAASGPITVALLCPGGTAGVALRPPWLPCLPLACPRWLRGSNCLQRQPRTLPDTHKSHLTTQPNIATTAATAS